MQRANPTRGFGLLEAYLSRKRAAKAHQLLCGHTRLESVVDIACGVPPTFLLSIEARQRVGIDLRVCSDDVAQFQREGMILLAQDVRRNQTLPFEDSSVDAVTMLAFVEHLPAPVLPPLLCESHRVLRSGGMLILTTPAAWTKSLLHILAALHVVSRVEIDDHEHLYGKQELLALLVEGGFSADRIHAGTFECGLNTWVCARK